MFVLLGAMVVVGAGRGSLFRDCIWRVFESRWVPWFLRNTVTHDKLNRWSGRWSGQQLLAIMYEPLDSRDYFLWSE